jgi:hypothetical protein
MMIIIIIIHKTRYVHDVLVLERYSWVKSQVSIDHSSDVCLNCYLKFPLSRHFLSHNIGRDFMNKKAFLQCLYYM